jgi:hypothetical protein
MEYEASVITIPIQAQTSNGRWEEEKLKLQAFMRLEVFPAYQNGLGTREFQFIIRDWELFGYSSLLNRLFMGDERGYLEKGSSPSLGREQAVMTFCVSHHYQKLGDDANNNFAAATELTIDNISHHDTDSQGNLYWHIDKDPDNKHHFEVRFSKKPHNRNSAMEDDPEIFESLVAKALQVAPGQNFKAVLGQTHGRNIVPLAGNTVLTANSKLRTPMSISWKLGKNPQIGSAGRIHVVSPSKSLCVAYQGPDVGHPYDSADFPARINYATSYHVYVNNHQFVEDQAGIATADGITQIPPRDIRVAFDKPHQGEFLNKIWRFSSGCCEGMHEITEAEYRQGQSIARYWRSNRLDVQAGEPSFMAPPLI